MWLCLENIGPRKLMQTCASFDTRKAINVDSLKLPSCLKELQVLLATFCCMMLSSCFGMVCVCVLLLFIGGLSNLLSYQDCITHTKSYSNPSKEFAQISRCIVLY